MLATRSSKEEPKSTVTDHLCTLFDVYTRSDLDGKWRELVKVYDQRKNDDNMKEILNVTTPGSRIDAINVWHLERMAVGELENKKDSNVSTDVNIIRKECKQGKEIIKKIVAKGKEHDKKRQELVETMIKQRDTLIHELDAAKEYLTQIHATEGVDVTAIELGLPVPVEQRLLSTVKPPETSTSVDLSDAPSI